MDRGPGPGRAPGPGDIERGPGDMARGPGDIERGTGGKAAAGDIERPG